MLTNQHHRLARHFLAAAAACALTLLAPGATESVTAPKRALGVQDSPGYRPPADPESASVRTGRRVVGKIDVPLSGGRRSLDALGQAIVGALRMSTDDSLFALCVSEGEFSKLMWPEFPQSRPATGWSAEDAWMVLYPRLRSGSRAAWLDARDHRYRFVRIERAKPIQEYTNFRLHDDIVLMVKDELDQVQRLTFVRSIVERRGVFKIYSTED
jgi:hypothetical protein